MANGVGCPGEALRAVAAAAAASPSISGRLTDRTTWGIALPYGVIATMYVRGFTKF